MQLFFFFIVLLMYLSLSPAKYKPSHGRNFWVFLLFNFWSAALSPYWALSEWMWKERDKEWFSNSVEKLAASQFFNFFSDTREKSWEILPNSSPFSVSESMEHLVDIAVLWHFTKRMEFLESYHTVHCLPNWALWHSRILQRYFESVCKKVKRRLG